MTPDGREGGITGGCSRIRDGFLTQRTATGIKKRWVVFQGDTGTGIFQVKVFKNSNEKILKIAHTVSKGTFVGIERGEFQDSKQNQKAGQPASYLAVLLVTDTLVFHGSRADLAKWHSAINKHFNSHSWDVVPMTGISRPESQVVLHITQHAMSLATANPPKHYQRWDLGRVADCGVWGARVYFHMDSSDSNKGYVEMRASTPDQAKDIREIVSRLLTQLRSGTERKVSLGQLVPAMFARSPISPRLRNMGQPATAISSGQESSEDTLVFNFKSSSASSGLHPTPPPVSPRPPSTLLSSPLSPPRSSSPLMLKLSPPPVKQGSPSSPKLPLPSPRSPGRHLSPANDGDKA